MANKKKLVTAGVALATAAALMLGGTFAWQSINQTALNEASDIVNPGGRLHDDFNGENKDVYVENFAEDEIFARIRLEEFFEVVLNKGTAGEKTVSMIGTKTEKLNEDGNTLYDYEYVVFTGYDDNDGNGAVNAGYERDDNGDVVADTDPWWTWTTGGDTVFMPTFNKNKDSLKADINGEYRFETGVITDKDIEGGQYTEMKTYEVDETKTANAIYDVDSNQADEIAQEDLAALIDGTAENAYSDHVKLLSEEHTAKNTGYAELISMTDWLALSDYDDEGNYVYNPDVQSGYWVYDEDGWVYWSAPIPAGEATGLLLNGIELNQVMDDSWYYAINVVAQFCTAGDMGTAPVYSDTEVDADGNPVLLTPGTGFYSEEDGIAPSDDALTLLELIGVNDTTSSTGDIGSDDPEQVYNMLVYAYKEPDGNAQYLVPGQEYVVEVVSEENSYNDTAVTLSVTMDDGTPLAESAYTLGSASISGGQTTVMGSEEGDTSAFTTLTILDEALVGQMIQIKAVADQTGNTATHDVSVNYEQIPVTITLYSSDGTPVAGTNVGGTIEPNGIYDIVGTIKNAANEDVVIYSTLDDPTVPDYIELKERDVVAHAVYSDSNYINEAGQLVVGEAETFNGNEVQEDGITYDDDLTISVGAEVVRIYENAEAMNAGEEPKEIYYAYGQWDLYPTREEKYDVYLDSVIYASQSDRTADFTVSDGNDANITDKVTYTIEGATDTTGTKIESFPADEYHGAPYAELTIGENETASELTVTATGTTGKGSKTVRIEYLNTLNIGENASDAWNDVNISSSDMELSYALKLTAYNGAEVSDVSYAISGAQYGDTRIDGSTLYVAAYEGAYPMILSATVDGVTTNYNVYVSYVPDETAPTVTFEVHIQTSISATISGLSDTDFPLTLTAYAQTGVLESGEAVFADDAHSTFNVTLTDGAPVVTGEGASYVNTPSYDAEAGTLTFIYSAGADGLEDYDDANNLVGLKLVVADKAGNKSDYPLSWTYGDGCFVAGTQVQTVSGLKNIEDIQLGDEVYSYDLTTGEKVVSTVAWVQGTRYIDATYTISAGGESFTATYEHPFYVIGEEWVAAEDLEVGDKLMDMNGNEVTITNIVYTELDEPVQVYNFTVDGTHNYLITESGILVHNIPSK